MREIEFRGKQIDNNEWVEGSLIIVEDDAYIVTIARNDWKKVQLYRHEVDPNTVGQFTGLYDKNGKKIFEGDVVKSKYFDKPQVVKWNNEWCAFDPIFDARPIEVLPILSDDNAKIEVIGNVYNNPELLEN